MFNARLALAHLYLRNHEDAVEWGRKAIRLPAAQWPAFCFLIAALAHLGRTNEAHVVIENLQTFRSGINLNYICKHYPSNVRENFDHFIDGLRKAGLPEE